jgi:hypothetical protein
MEEKLIKYSKKYINELYDENEKYINLIHNLLQQYLYDFSNIVNMYLVSLNLDNNYISKSLDIKDSDIKKIIQDYYNKKKLNNTEITHIILSFIITYTIRNAKLPVKTYVYRGIKFSKYNNLICSNIINDEQTNKKYTQKLENNLKNIKEYIKNNNLLDKNIHQIDEYIKNNPDKIFKKYLDDSINQLKMFSHDSCLQLFYKLYLNITKKENNNNNNNNNNIITSNSLYSTSIYEDISKDFVSDEKEQFIFRIFLPKGASGLYLTYEPISSYNEFEIIISSCSQFSLNKNIQKLIKNEYNPKKTPYSNFINFINYCSNKKQYIDLIYIKTKEQPQPQPQPQEQQEQEQEQEQQEQQEQQQQQQQQDKIFLHNICDKYLKFKKIIDPKYVEINKIKEKIKSKSSKIINILLSSNVNKELVIHELIEIIYNSEKNKLDNLIFYLLNIMLNDDNNNKENLNEIIKIYFDTEQLKENDKLDIKIINEQLFPLRNLIEFKITKLINILSKSNVDKKLLISELIKLMNKNGLDQRIFTLINISNEENLNKIINIYFDKKQFIQINKFKINEIQQKMLLHGSKIVL